MKLKISLVWILIFISFNQLYANKIRYGIDKGYPPFEFFENGEAKGFNVDLMKEIAKNSGFELEIVALPWPQLRSAFDSNKIDIVAMFYTKNRDYFADFSVPFIEPTFSVYANKLAPQISKLSNLNGKKVLIESSDFIRLKFMNLVPDAQMVIEDDPAVGLKKLEDNQYPYAVSINRIGSYYTDIMNYHNIKNTGLALFKTQYSYAVHEENFELISKINEGLLTARENGKFHQIYKRWFGKLENESTSWRDVFYITLYIVIALIIIGIIVGLWIKILKRTVNQKTKELKYQLEATELAQTNLQIAQFALDHANDCILKFDDKGNILYANLAACNSLLYSYDEIIKLNVINIDANIDLSNHQRIIEKIKKEQSLKFESIQVRKDNTTLHVDGYIFKLDTNQGEVFYSFSRDITDKLNWETQLKNSEEQFRNMFHKHSSVMFIIDPETKVILDANQAALEFYNYDRDEFIGKRISHFNKMDEISMDSLVENIKSGKLKKYENLHFLSDGCSRAVEVSCTFINISNRDVLFFIVLDITEKKNALNALIDSEAKFSKTFMISPGAFLLTRASNGIIVDVNEAFLNLSGFDINEVIGRTTIDINVWESIEFREEVIADILKYGCIDIDNIKFITKNGSTIICNLSARTTDINSETYILSVLQDVTEKVHLQEQILKEREQLEVTLRSIGDGVIVTDEFGKVILLNDISQELTGWKEKDAMGRPVEEIFQIVNETSREIVENPVRAALSKGIAVGLANHTALISKDGNELIIADSASPIRNSENKIIGVVLVFRDITALTIAEANLKKEKDFTEKLLNIVGAIVCVIDKDFNIFDVNKECTNVSGYFPNELKGKKIFDILIPDEFYAEYYHIFNRIRGGDYPLKFDSYWHNKLNALKLVSWNCTGIFDETGELEFYVFTGIDITELREKENKIYDLAKQYETIVEASGQVVYLLDTETNRMDWGGSLFSVMGYKPEDIGVSLDDHISRIHPEDKGIVSDYLHRAMNSEEQFSLDYRILHKSGAYIWVHDNALYLKNDSNNASKMLGVIQNIDFRKKEEFYKSAIFKISESTNTKQNFELLCREIHTIISDLMPAKNVYIALIDESNKIYYPYWEDEIDPVPEPHEFENGLTEYVIKTGQTILVDPDEFYNMVDKGLVKEIGAPSIDWLGAPLVTKEGIIGAIVIQSYTEGVRYTNEHKRILGFVSHQIAMAIQHKKAQEELQKSYEELEDRVEEKTIQLKTANEELQAQIEERLRIEREIRESEVRFKSMADSAPVLIWLTDSKGKMRYLNNTWFEFTGGNPDTELIDGWLARIHPEDLEYVKKSLDDSIRKQQRFNIEFRLFKQFSDYRWVMMSAVPRHIDDDIFYGFIGSGIDITEMKLSLEKEKEVNFMKTRFISTVSHEYRTPLTTILTSTYLVDNFINSGNNEEAKKFLNRIQNSVNNMTKLLDQVLTISRADSGKLVYNPQLINIHNTLVTIIEEIKLYDKDNHKINISTNLKKPEAFLDLNLLHQIISNLLTNAVKYSDPHSEVEISVKSNDLDVIFEIIDRGRGIPEEQIQHLFEPFFRATNVGVIQGTGLGLSIVKRCVDASHGKIEVFSQVDKGTRFVVTIPYGDV